MNKARASLKSEAAQAQATQRQEFGRNDERERRAKPTKAALLKQRGLVRSNARLTRPFRRPASWSAQHQG